MAASTAPADWLSANIKVALYDHDPGGTTATMTSPDGGTTVRSWDMRDFTHFEAVAMTTIAGGSGITLLEIVAATDAVMTTPVVVRAHAATVADAVGDYVKLEITAEDLQEEGTADLRYVAARLTMATGTDEAVVAYIGKPKRPQKDLTTTTIA